MEFGPIFRSLRKNRIGVMLIALEVALTLAVVVNSINLVMYYTGKVNRPLGFDIDHLLFVQAQHWDGSLKDETFIQQQIDKDLRTLRALDGVRFATVVGQVPVSSSGSSDTLFPVGKVDLRTGFAHFRGDETVVDSFGLTLIEGRGFTRDEVAGQANVMIITKELAEVWFPDESAVGKEVQNREGTVRRTVVGVVEQMAGSWPGWSGFYRNALYPTVSSFGETQIRYLVRTEPGSVNRLIPQIETALSANYDKRIYKVRTLNEIKANTYNTEIGLSKLLIFICVVLVFVTALGITGLTTFWVSRRIKHIGIRRALGARKVDILRYFLLENSLISLLGLSLGAVLTILLNRVFIANFSFVPALPFFLLPAGMVSLWLLGLVAVYFPALRASRIDPAMATKTV